MCQLWALLYTLLQNDSFFTFIKISNTEIKCVDNCQYLDVTIDNKLKWTAYIDKVILKLKRLVGICCKLRYKLPDWCLQDIYYAFIYPYILYGLEVYGNTCVSYMDKLTKLNNKLLRILQKKKRKCCNECLLSSTVLYLHLSCLIITSWAWYTKWCIYHICCHLYSGITSLFPHRFIPIMLDIKSFLSQANTQFGQRSLKFKGGQLWNRLPQDLVNMSFGKFRNCLKLFLNCEPL